MNHRSPRNQSQSSYSSSRSGLPNNGRNQPYRSDYQPRYGAGSQSFDHETGERYEGIQYGRDHAEQNEDQSFNSYRNQENPQYGSQPDRQDGNRFNQNPSAYRGFSSSTSYGTQQSNQYGRSANYGQADRSGGAENYADRGYSQQAGGWGSGREGQVGQHTGRGEQQYPSTEHFSAGQGPLAWSGNPSPNSSYGNNYMNWDQDQKESHAGRGPKGYRRPDERIHEEASEALTHAHHVDASEIEVDVKEGIVTLTGTVPKRRMKRAAEEIVEHLSGVKDVKNNLTVNANLATGANASLEGDKSGKKSTASAAKLQ